IVGAKKCGASSAGADGSVRRPDCVAAVREQSRDRNQHYAETVARRHRVLTIAAWLAVMVSTSFVLVQIVTDTWSWQITSINLGAAAIFAFVPRLHRFGDLVAPLTFVGAAYISVFASTWDIGTGAGGEFFFLGAAVWWCCCWASSTLHWPPAWRRSPPGGSSRWSSWSRATPGCNRPGPSRWVLSSPRSP